MHHAARYGAVGVMKEILAKKKKQDINAFATFGRTPLTLAIFQGHLEMVELLMKHGADINCSEKNCPSPLQTALDKLFLFSQGAASLNPADQMMYDRHLAILKTLLKNEEQLKAIPTSVLMEYKKNLYTTLGHFPNTPNSEKVIKRLQETFLPLLSELNERYIEEKQKRI